MFCSATLLDTFITCNTDPQHRPQKTDHMPIISSLEIETDQMEFEAKPNYRLTNWEDFRKTLAERTKDWQEPEEIGSIAEFHTNLERLDIAIKATIAKHVPWMKPSPYSKRWWMRELGVLKKAKERLARLSYERRAMNAHPIHEVFRQTRNKYSQAIRNTKAEHWVEWLELIDEEGIWAAN